MKIIIFFFFIILMSHMLLIYNCNKSPTESDIEDLVNKLWTLESFLINGKIIKPPDTQIYNVQFKENGRFSGVNDCNDFGGEYEIKSDNLIIIYAGGSEANCPNSMYREYLEAFSTAKSYKIIKNNLNIYYGTNSALIFYRE